MEDCHLVFCHFIPRPGSLPGCNDLLACSCGPHALFDHGFARFNQDFFCHLETGRVGMSIPTFPLPYKKGRIKVSCYICEECMKKYYSVQNRRDLSYPSCTIASGIAGTFAGLVTGAVFLIPLFLLGGYVADKKLRCNKCGGGKNLHLVMAESKDEPGKYYPFTLPIPEPFRDELEEYTFLTHDDRDTNEISIFPDDFPSECESLFDIGESSLEVGYDIGGFEGGCDGDGSDGEAGGGGD